MFMYIKNKWKIEKRSRNICYLQSWFERFKIRINYFLELNSADITVLHGSQTSAKVKPKMRKKSSVILN